MNTALAILGSAFVLVLILGLLARRGRTMDLEQWSLGGRGLGSLLVFLLAAGENFTTYTFLGGSGGAYSMGGPMIYMFSSICYVVFYWLAPPIWAYARRHKLLTAPDLYAHKYRSKGFGVLTAVVGVVSLVPYLVLQLKGLGIIVHECSYGRISQGAAVWIGVAVIAVYVTVSGLRGTAWNAIIKDTLMLVLVVGLGLYLPIHYYGGLGDMFQALSAAHPHFLTLPDHGYSVWWYISTSLLFALGICTWPHMMPGILAARSAKALRRNAVITPAYQIVLVMVLVIGFTAVLKVPGLKDGDLALLSLAKDALPPWLVGLVGVAGMLAALVPGAMLLQSAAMLVAKNIYQTARPATSERTVGRLSRLLVPVLALVAAVLTFRGGEAIAMLLIMAYGFVVQLFPVLVASMWRRNPVTTAGAWAGVCTGVAIVSWTTLTDATSASLLPWAPRPVQDLDVGVVAMVANILVLAVVSAATRHRAGHRDDDPRPAAATTVPEGAAL
ncbi:sodium:solute symporter family protein [Streptomyces fractus]|uniref:sodium:solute symporter family protein n=1 Tax=Streptomyces fractus TaxID=641806 RepID=UPI003CF4B939